MKRLSVTTFTVSLSMLLCSVLIATAQPVTDAQGDVGIGTFAPDPSAKLDLTSTSKGFLLPRMTTVQRDAIVSPAVSLMIFNTTVGDFQYWDGNTLQWETVITTANANLFTWRTIGNNSLTAWNGVAGNFLGMQDNVDLVLKTENASMQFWTSNTERARFDAAGNFFPATDNAYSLGTNTNRWQDIYANGGSVHIGPSGGDGVSELELGYAAGTGSINVDGAGSEIDITVGNTTVNNNLNAALNFDVTGISTLNGAVALGDAPADAISLNGTLTGLGSGHSLGTLGTDANVLTINGDDFNVGQYELDVQGDVNISGVLALPGLGPNAVLYTNAAGVISTDNPPFAYDDVTNTMTTENVVVTTSSDLQGPVANSTGNLNLNDDVDVTGILDAQTTIVNTTGDVTVNDNLDVVGVVDAQSAGNTVGDGTASRQLTVEGSADAVIGNTVAGNPTVWDQVVEGDLAATGLIKAGGSMWIDGATPGNHQVVANDALNVGTTNGNNLTLSTNATNAVVVDGATQDVNILNNVDVDGDGNVDGSFNVVGPATMQSTLVVSGITTLQSNLNVDGPTDLNSTLNVDGAVTINNTIDQVGGGQITLSGNVDANNGLDVSGQDLNVDAGVSVEAPGDGHTFGTAAVDAQVVEILGDPFNVGNYELFVDGDVQITGILSLPGLGANAIVVTDAAGNLITDNPPLGYDATTDVMTAPDIVPSADNTYALGTDATRWSEVYVNGGSVHIGASGGEAGNTELNIGWAANTGTLNVNGGPSEVNITTATTNITNDLDVDGNGNVDGTFNVVGPSTAQSTLEVDGITTLHSNLNVDGPTDLNSTLNVDGATTINNTITQTGGGQVEFSGNVDANNGVDVSGADLTVDAGVSVEAPGAGHTFGTLGVDNQVVEILGDNFNVGQYELVVDGDAQITGFLSLPGFATNAVVITDAAGNLVTDAEFLYDNVTNVVDVQGTIINSAGNLTLDDDVDITGVLDAQAAGNTIGDGSAVTQLTINGVQDATGAETIPDPAFDVAVVGDIGATGIIKSGASIVIDGVSNPRRVESDDVLNINTTVGDINMNPAGGDVNVTGNANATNDVTAGNDFVLTAAAGTIHNSADPDVTVDDNLVVNGDISTFGPGTSVTAVNDVIAGSDVVAGGDVIMQSATSAITNTFAGTPVRVDDDFDVVGNSTLNGDVDLGDAAGDAVTLNGTLTGAGANHSLGTAAVDANVLSILGDPFNVGDYELFVDGDVQITGLLSLPALSGNSIVVTDAAGNLITDNPPLGYDATTDVMTAPDIVPSADNTYSLGTDGTRWADVYVNGGSVHIGDAGGEAGNAEMNLGYAANSATINVDGGNAEWEMDAGAGIFRWDPDADGTLNMSLNSSRLSLNTGVGADLFITQSSLEYNSAASETLSLTNIGAGDANLDVQGDVSVGDDLILTSIGGTISNSVGTSVLVDDDITVLNAGDLIFDQVGSVIANTGGSVVVQDDLNVTGSADIDTDLNVDGNTVHVGTLDQQGAVSNSTGDVVINDDANVTGSLDVDTDLNVDGNTTHVGTLDQQGAVSNSTGDVVINDDANVTGSLDVDTDLNVDGNTVHVGTLDQQGAVSNSTGDVVINDDANVTGSLDVDTDLNTDGNATLNGNVDLGDAAGDAITLNGTLTGAGSGHSLGTAATDANVLSILGDPLNVGDYELFVDGDVQITGFLSLPGLTPNAVVFVDAAGNFATEGTAGDFYWDETNNRLGIGNGGVAPTEALDVTGNIEATGTIQSGTSIIIDGTTPGAHNITATGGENLTLTPTGGTLFSNAPTFDHGAGLFTVTPGAVTYNGPQMVMPGIFDVNPGSLDYLAGLLTVNPGTATYNGAQLLMPGILDVNPGSLNYQAGLLTVDPGTLQYGGGLFTVDPGTLQYNAGLLTVDPGTLQYGGGLFTVTPGAVTYNGAQLVMPGIFDVNPGSLDYSAGAFNVDAVGNTQISGNLNVDGNATLNGDVDLGDAAADAVTLNGTLTGAGSGHSLGTAAVDANVLTINGDPNNVGQYELDVQGDVNIAGILTLPGVNPNSVLVTDAAGNIITDNEFAYDATTNVLDIQGTIVNSTGDVTVDDNLNVTGSADIDTDLNVDGNTVHVGTLDQQGAVSNSTGDVVINDDANVTGSLDVDTDLNVDGNTTHVGTLDQQGAVSNSTGDVVINDDANVTGSLDVDTDLNVDGNTTHVGTLDQQGAVSNSTGDVVVNDDFNVTGSADVDTDLNVDGNTTMVGSFDAQDNGNTIGDGTAVTQLTINGVQDATGVETLPNAVFDLAVTGDIGATGIIKSGAGVWIDGVSATHSVTADQPLDVETIGANPLTLSTNGTVAVTVNGTTQNVNIANNLSVDGATTLGDGLDLTTINGPLTQAGAANQVTFGGNVDAQNGLDVAGGNLNVVNNANITGDLGVDGNATLGNNAADAIISNGTFTAINTTNLNGTVNLGDAAADAVNLNGTLTGTGNGHSLGTLASDANVLTINGLANNAPAYELIVNGDMQVTGILSFPGLTPNAVMFVDAAGNMATEGTAGDFYWDETNNRLGIGNGGVAPTEALDVTGNIEATGTIQSGTSIIIDGTTPGSHNISTTGVEDLAINPGGGDLVVNGNTNVTGSVDVDTDLNVDGNTTHVGTLDQQGAVSNSTGDVVINDDANVTGSLDVDTDLNVDGNTTHVGTLDQQGAVSNSTGDVVINDDANVTGSLDVDTDLNVDGNTTHVGTLDQQGDIANSTGSVTVADNFVVTATSDLQGAVSNSTGDVVISDDVNVTGSVDIDTDLNVDGNTTHVGTLDQQGAIGNTTGALDIQDDVDISGDVDVNGGNFTVSAATGNTDVGGTLDVTGAVTLDNYSGGGNQSLYVDNTGAVQASNATAAQNATGIFTGQVTVAAPNAGGTEAIANTNVVAGSVIVITRVSGAGGQLSHHISAVNAGVGFTVQFSAPVTAGDQINYMIINP